nr:unnamed protein product [Callosobruchus analis]
MLPVSQEYYRPYSDDDGGDDNIQIELSYYHSALIKDLSRLLRRQTTDLNNKRFYCIRCLNHFYFQKTLNKHIFTCRKMNKTKITPPLGDEKYISFSDFRNKEKVPFVIYADLEGILKDYKDSKTGTINRYQKHIPFSIAYYSLCTYDNSRSKFNLYTGRDCITWFVKQLQQIAVDLNSIFSGKGMFPYDYLGRWNKLEENKLPPPKAFFSKHRNCGIKKAEYEHALEVWNTFKVQNLQEYMELYLKTDVLLLADVFENFRKVCMKAYNLECLKYYTAPGLAYASALKMSRVTLELLDDVDKIMFIERGIRGGISQSSNRYGKANNIYMENEYNPNLPTSYLTYYDINNMYGTALREALPIENFTCDKKDKRITSSSLKRITFEDYYKCFFNQVNLSTNESLIRSKKHEVYTISQKKVALTPYDDKRIVNYVYTDTRTLPWGYQKNN